MSQSSNSDSFDVFQVPSTEQAIAQESVLEKTVSFPSSLVEKIHWPLSFRDSSNVSDLPDDQHCSPNSPSTFTFPEGILSEVQAAVSYAFSPAVQMANVDVHGSFPDGNDKPNTKFSPVPIISLYYPHDGCHDIIDSMVKSLALEQGADVVVLDSLELALGEFGAFGKEAAHAIDMLYPAPRNAWVWEDEHDSDSHHNEARTIQKMFDDIVDIRREPDALHGDSIAIEQAQSRIVYMRDFGSIAPSAIHPFSYLLQALRTRRTAGCDKDSLGSKRSFQPTVLILGFSETPKVERNWGEVDAKPVLRNFVEGGVALRTVLSELNNEQFTVENLSPLSPLCGSFFLRSLVHPRKLHTNTTPVKHHLTFKSDFNQANDLTSIGAVLSIFPEDSHTDGFREVEKRMARRRRQDVQNAWMTVCLGRRGAVVCENPLGSVQDYGFETSASREERTANPPIVPESITSLDGLCNRSDLPLPVVLDRIAEIALGLSPSQSSPSTAAVQITSTAVSRAYQLFSENWEARSDWFNTVNKKQEKEDRKEEDREGKDEWESESEEEDENEDGTSFDPIIKKVEGSSDLNSYEERLLDCIVDKGNIATTFEDICIPGKVIDSLRTIVSLPLLHPSAFKVGILGREAIGGVLLYGPPGTGKTLVCRALARECGARMLQLKPSDIMDRWLGESEKLAKNVFSLAYRLAPCVIFIDEMDSLFKARTGNDDRQYYRDILNEFLQSMDGLQSSKKNKEAGVVVVGATNRPYDLDNAVLRRLATRMMVDLPGEQEREQILRLHLRDEKLDEGVNLGNIARNTHYYSGSDLKNLCVSAAMESVKETLGDFSWTPKTPLEPSVANDKLDQSDTPLMTDSAESKIHTRTITLAHFTHAINDVSPSSLASSHSELYRWHEQFGRKRTLDNISCGRSPANGSIGFGSTGSYGGRAGGYGGNAGGYSGGVGRYNRSLGSYLGGASG